MIFELSSDGTHAIVSPEFTEIPEFQTLLKRPNGIGLRELLYVYHMVDPESPYSRLEEERREESIANSFLPKGWKPDAAVKAAVTRYSELSRTVYQDLMDSADIGIHKLKEYFETVDLTILDEKSGKPVYSARDLVSNLEKIGAVVRSHTELRKLIEEARTETDRNRKGIRTNKYNG